MGINHKEPDFLLKGGIQMRITQTTAPIMKNAEMMALLCAFAQLALAAGLFWAFKAHIV